MRLLAFSLLLALSACGGGGDAVSCAVLQDMHRAVNEARSQPRYCGDKLFASAPPLRLSFTLAAASEAHARDMAGLGFVAHAGSDGSRSADRAARVGYSGAVYENVAGGPDNLQEVMREFLSSPGHCMNIMWPDHQEFGAACVEAGGSPFRIHWVQVFGRPAS